MKAIATASAAVLMACAGGSKQVKPQSTEPQSAEAKAAAEQDKKDEQKLICVWEKPPGSNIPEKVCRMPEQIEHDRDEAQRTMQSVPSVQGTSKG
jgi:hypothetical protein